MQQDDVECEQGGKGIKRRKIMANNVTIVGKKQDLPSIHIQKSMFEDCSDGHCFLTQLLRIK